MRVVGTTEVAIVVSDALLAGAVADETGGTIVVVEVEVGVVGGQGN